MTAGKQLQALVKPNAQRELMLIIKWVDEHGKAATLYRGRCTTGRLASYLYTYAIVRSGSLLITRY